MKRRNGSPVLTRAENGAPMEWLRGALRQETDECLPYPFATENGYGAVNHEGSKRTASSVVCLLAHGEPPFINAEAAHRCGNRPCCNKRHIRWATAEENQRDRRLHGTVLNGERSPVAKLTWSAVRAIRASTATQEVIASAFGVSRAHVGAIRQKRYWIEEEAA